MKIISQNRDIIVSFETGVWILKDTTIMLMSNHTPHNIQFATYETVEEAKREFELFIKHIGNMNLFDFSKNHFDK